MTLWFVALLMGTTVWSKKVISVVDDNHAYDVINNKQPPSNIPVSVVLHNSDSPSSRADKSGQLSSSLNGMPENLKSFDLPLHAQEDASDLLLAAKVGSSNYLPPVPPILLPLSKNPHKSEFSSIGAKDELPKFEDKKLNNILQEENADLASIRPASALPEQKLKVYSLVLNSDKHSWCEPQPIRQIVTHAHCKSKEMENFVCVGSCFSYSVPQTMPETPGDEMLDYCDSCQAEKSFWTTVQLECEDDGAFYTVTKNIQRIANCSCLSCHNTKRPIYENFKREKSKEPSTPTKGSIDEDKHFESGLLDRIDFGEHRREQTGDTSYSQMTLRELKEEFELSAKQEALLRGKVVNKDEASFVDDENYVQID